MYILGSICIAMAFLGLWWWITKEYPATSVPSTKDNFK
jgi:hypothetical protein